MTIVRRAVAGVQSQPFGVTVAWSRALRPEAAVSVEPSRHRHLELARSEIIQLLSRQALEMAVVNRWQQSGQELVTQLVERQHRAAIGQRLSKFHPADIAFVLESLEPEARDPAWALVRPSARGAVLLELSDPVRRTLVQGMPPERIAEVIVPLAPEEIAALLSDLPEATRQAVLDQLDGPNRANVDSVLAFPKGSVGAAMDRNFMAVNEHASLASVLQSLREQKPLPAEATQLFVVDRRQRPRGVLSLAKLLQADPNQTVDEAMGEAPLFFHTDEPMRDAATAFEKYAWDLFDRRERILAAAEAARARWTGCLA